MAGALACMVYREVCEPPGCPAFSRGSSLRAQLQRFRLPVQHVQRARAHHVSFGEAGGIALLRADAPHWIPGSPGAFPARATQAVPAESPPPVGPDNLQAVTSDPGGLSDLECALGCGEQDVLTLCVNKVPTNCSLRQLLDYWTPDPALRLVHYPYNRKKQRRLGFCFVHFQSAASAGAFWRKWHGRYLAHSREPLHIVSAKVQGFANTLEHYRGWQFDDMAHEELLPAIFEDGRLMDPKLVLAALGIVEHPHAQLRGDPSEEAVLSL